MDKLPRDEKFVDLSDYSRPLANLLVRLLLPLHFISPIFITWCFTLVGLIAAYLIWEGIYISLAAILLVFKSFLDATDGALARARKKPSLVGRYLDSVNDFIVNLALFLAIARYTDQPIAVALAALIMASLQGTVYNYYYLIKRHSCAGDKTSRLDEWNKPAGYPWDNAHALRVLHYLYLIIYGWQDKLIYILDHAARKNSASLTSGFMSATSILALGFQLLFMCAMLLIDFPCFIFLYFIFIATIYSAVLILIRRRC